MMIFLIAFMNILGFALVGIDKRRAVHHEWRIPEKTFFLVSILAGSVGTLAGMYVFRHKTRHLSFVIGIPLILCLQIFISMATILS